MESDTSTRVDAASLRAFVGRVFGVLGVPEEDARLAADVVVTADLRGISSHGVARLRSLYVSRLQSGVVLPRPHVELLHETPATALIDGNSGLGQPIAYRAMKLAIAKARAAGAGFVSVRNSNHFGIAGYYAMLALEEDCIGLCMTSSSPWMPPTFGREALLGTNPIAIAAPAGRERPFVLDMATTVVTGGNLELRERLGLEMEPGWAVDERGLPVTDPGTVLRNIRNRAGGGLLPLGGAGEERAGYKGYGLAVTVDIFSALLSGERYSGQVRREAPGERPRQPQVGHFFGAWSVEAFRPLAEFRAEMDGMLAQLKGSQTADGQARIWVAGEKEYEEMERRLRDGIPLSAVVADDLHAMAGELGVTF